MECESYRILFESEDDHWWLSSRREIVLDWVEERYRSRDGLVLLDVGCGTGRLLCDLGRYGEAYGVDGSTEALDFSRARGLRNLEQADVRRLPFRDATFDVITAVDILEHVEDDVAAVREWRRVLKPGGRVFIFSPAHKWLWSLQDEVAHHWRRYTAPSLDRVVEGGGLRIERRSYVSAYLLPVILLGRIWLRIARRWKHYESENDLHPAWANALLGRVFRAEIPRLRRKDLPIGASLLCVAGRDESALRAEPPRRASAAH